LHVKECFPSAFTITQNPSKIQTVQQLLTLAQRVLIHHPVNFPFSVIVELNMLNVIACPSCKTEIEVSEIMAAQLSATLRAEMEAQLAAERRALGDRARQIEEQDRLLQDERGKFELQIQTRLANEQQRLLTEARAEATRELSVEMTAREEKSQSLQKAAGKGAEVGIATDCPQDSSGKRIEPAEERAGAGAAEE